MRRVIRWLGLSLATVLALCVLGVAFALIALNHDFGRHWASRLIAYATAGEVRVSAVSGRFPDRLVLGDVRIAEPQGLDLVASELTLDWSPVELLHGLLRINRLTARHLVLNRLSGPGTPASEGTPASAMFTPPALFPALPVRVAVAELKVDRLDLAPEIAGIPAAFAAQGSLRIESTTEGEATLHLHRLDAPGRYALTASSTASRVSLTLRAHEPATGLIGAIAEIPVPGPVTAEAKIEGPWEQADAKARVKLGPVEANLGGRINLLRLEANLALRAETPGLALLPGVSWHSLRLDAELSGRWPKPAAHAVLRVTDLQAAGAILPAAQAVVQASGGTANLEASLQGLSLPAPVGSLFAQAPLALHASLPTDNAQLPLQFSLSHPLLKASGEATLAAPHRGRLVVNLPELAPFVAAGGAALHGGADITLEGTLAHGAGEGNLEAKFALKEPTQGSVLAVLGANPEIRSAFGFEGGAVRLSAFTLKGAALQADAQGGMHGQELQLAFSLALRSLTAFSPSVSGAIEGRGAVSGSLERLSATTEIQGHATVENVPLERLHVNLTAHDLPSAPSAQLSADALMADAPLQISLTAVPAPGGATKVALANAAWKSMSARGEFTVLPHALLPIGELEVKIAQLEDLTRFIGRNLRGALIARAGLQGSSEHQELALKASLANAAMGGEIQIAQAELETTLKNPLAKWSLSSRLRARALRVGQFAGNLSAEADGPGDALALRATMDADAPEIGPMKAQSSARLNAEAKELLLRTLTVSSHKGQIRLAKPSRIRAFPALEIDHLVLLSGAAQLAASGRLAPTLDFAASLHNFNLALAQPFLNGMKPEGVLNADARLQGLPSRPSGSLHLDARGLRLQTASLIGMPAATLNAAARISDGVADVQARLDAAKLAHLMLSGRAPFSSAGHVQLRAQGSADLELIEPIVAAQGRHIAGGILFDATVTGSPAAPQLAGTMQLDHGEVTDFVTGAHLAEITAFAHAAASSIVLDRFSARAGSGTITANGSIGILQPDTPVDLRLTARRANPVSTDRLSMIGDADIIVSGAMAKQLLISGDVRVDRAEIGVPDTIPASVPVLPFRIKGEPPPPPPSPPPAVALNLSLAAQQVFVHGRGITAELRGKMQLGGTLAAPEPRGAFRLVRGEVNLGGNTLRFTSGKVSFNGTDSLAGEHGIDPFLDFEATSVTTYQNAVATLHISGYASDPKITLSSTPPLPQDTIMALLLFGQPAATLSPFQVASVAAGLAQLSGNGGGDVLNDLRSKLGLDRLSIGTRGAATGATAGTASAAQGALAPTLQAGRYVAPGVYVGTQQSVSGGNYSTVQVQIDLTKRLKVQAGAGSGPGANALGLTYQSNY